MPSPIAHVAAGYLICRVYPRQQSVTRRRYRLAITIFFSLLPDVDIILGLLFHNMRRYHNGITHSFFVGIILSYIFGAIVKRNHNLAITHFFTLTLISHELHILLDYLARGKRGVMLFWPFSKRRFRFPKKLFYGVKWDAGILSGSHLKTAITEFVFVALFYLLLRLIKRILMI